MYSNKFDPIKTIVVSQPVSNNGGPRTEAGKEISSRNATRHGCCSIDAKLILPNEKIEDFKTLEAARFRSYEPKDATEIDLIHQLVTAEWLLQRSVRTLIDIEAQIFAAQPVAVGRPTAQPSPVSSAIARPTKTPSPSAEKPSKIAARTEPPRPLAPNNSS